MSLSISAIRTIVEYYPMMRREPRYQHALREDFVATSMDDLNAKMSRYRNRVLYVTLHGGGVGKMENNGDVDVFLTIVGVKRTIRSYEFSNILILRGLDLSNTRVSTIESDAFVGCRNLKTVILS